MGLNAGTGDRQAQTEATTAAGVGTTAAELDKGFKDFFQPLLRQPRTLIGDLQAHLAVSLAERHVGRTAMLQGVVDQVGQGTFERQRSAA